MIACRPGWTSPSNDDYAIGAVPVPPSRIDDGYCDCPYDGGIDEPNTSACSGSTADGYSSWAGMGVVVRDRDRDRDRRRLPARKFACPRQPSLLLPYSRLNDGICDCCDGADEMSPSSSSSSSSSSSREVGVAAASSCPDTCEGDLANERATREKLASDYEVGSARRLESTRSYAEWRARTHDEIRRLKYEEMAGIEMECKDASRVAKDATTGYATARVRDVASSANDVGEALWGALFENDDVDVDGSTRYYGLSSLIISFCGLSAEISSENYVDGRCVPLVEAGKDAGMTWHDDDDDDGGGGGGGDASSASSSLPAFEKIDPTSEDALSAYADAMVLRLEGRKKERGAIVAAASSSAPSRSSSPQQREEEEKEVRADYEPRYDSFDDDYYGHDDPEEEERWLGGSWSDAVEEEESTGGGGGGSVDDPSSSRTTGEKDYGGREEGGSEVEISKDGKEEGGEKRREGQHQSWSSSPPPDDEILVKSLLDSVPLDRTLFKNRAETLLRSSSMVQPRKEEDSTNVDGEERIVDAPPSEDGSSADDEGSISGDDDAGKVDPMAAQMAKSALSKYLSQITRGESSMMSAARYVASVMRGSDLPLDDLRTLAIMTMYHGDVALEDVAELIYLTCGALRSSTPDEEGGSRRRGEVIAGGDYPSSSSSCPSRSSDICPPRTVLVGGKEHPPLFVLEAARRRCDRREGGADSGACAARDDDGGAIKFPTSVSDGYYDYYAPQPRGPDDGLTSVFSAIDSLFEPPSNILELRKREEALNGKKKTLSKRVADLEREISDGDGGGDGRLSKYGIDGELFALRDTCHKVMYLKYEYEVCIFGSATQRDGGSNGVGGTNLGSWKAAYVEGGRRTLRWEGGTKCWNGPARSAEVSVTCGADTRLLTADEPETCRYVFTMESPIGCDEEFKIRNSL
ncbi:hypothetical protein ACHAW5_000679 [Stephanodiscus triporus]|uniref:MRH domain-containing protein n=1 Tax=Stephanodiscus triporus TaxID=2934178 RepID=A0ABD3NW47_9STRA